MVGSSLLTGTGVGFTLATVLALVQVLHIPFGPWWIATAQVHGHKDQSAIC
jgi:hypothetical protein